MKLILNEFYCKIFIFSIEIFQYAITPFKYLGVFGLSNNPIYFNKGDKIPIWLFACSGLKIDFTFDVNCEVYFDNVTGRINVHPVNFWDNDKPLLILKNVLDLTIIGAPTSLIGKCRIPPSSKYKLSLIKAT